MLTDVTIRAALRTARPSTLTDPGPRGAGRLVLRLQPPRAEWFAVRHQAGRRRFAKLGDYPAMTLAQAREAFGGAPADRPERGLTFAAMVDGYLEWLATNRPASAENARQILADCVRQTSSTKLAADVTPADVVALIRPVFDRGARSQAAHYRRWLRSAFKWALESAHDYTRPGGKDWGLRGNPVAAIPWDAGAFRAGHRWLSADEFRALLRWCARSRAQSAKVLAVLALTGQRVREISRLRREQWDGELLTWTTTKTGRAHVIPVCDMAARVLDGFTWEPVQDFTMLSAAGRTGLDFTPRDLRRTWATLAGQAGLTPDEIRLLQGHAPLDVAMRHYHRDQQLAAKRAAVAKWDAWLHQQCDK